MTSHSLKIVWRNLSRQKALSFINILGLSIGFACFSLFLLYAINEFSYDRFHKDAANIYRVYEWTEGIKGSEPSGDAWLYMPLGPAMKKDLPGVENYVRYNPGNAQFIRAGNQTLKITVSFADPDFFRVFSFSLLSGSPVSAFKDQRNVVLTRATALQLFGQTNIIGKSLDIKEGDKFEPFVVSAVTENIPANSSIQFNVLLSFDYLQTRAFEKNAVNNWNYNGFINFVQLRKGSKLADEKELLSKFRQKYFPEEKMQLLKNGQWDGKTDYPVSFRLQPLRQVHTDTRISAGIQRGTDTQYVWILMGIATGLLLIACINFTTLSIGRSAGRAKEIGLRKIIGSDRKRLIYQFLAEAVLLSLVSAILGLILLPLLLPYFNMLSGKELVFSFWKYPELSFFFAAAVLFTGGISGIYPALVLSGFKPIEVLKNKIHLGGANFFTKSLVTVQFVLSITLIISTIFILRQLDYMRSKNPGFDKENVVVLDAQGTNLQKIYPVFKRALLSSNLVAGISGSDAPFGQGYNQSGFDYHGQHEQAFHFNTDADFMQVMGIELVAGRNFDPNNGSDSLHAAIVNEAMVTDLGMTNDQILGLKLSGYSRLDPVVIGVVKNFNFLPLRQKISALLIRPSSVFVPNVLFVKLKAGNPALALKSMKKTWDSLVPDIPFHYSFLVEDLGRLYQTEIKWSGIVGWAGGISIFLACLGLFGLAALTAVNRTREIGIRKVLGGSMISIVQLLSTEFLKLIFISFLIAAPLSWYFINKWLEDYAYRINLEWWVFAISGSAAMVIAFTTVGYHAIKAAISNPIQSLRNE
jgi:putative ABC transport system permease protein